jgi:hypothetical protein
MVLEGDKLSLSQEMAGVWPNGREGPNCVDAPSTLVARADDFIE